MSEEYEDDIEEQEETELRGEYVWDGNHLTSTDTNVNDTGHEGFILNEIVGTLYDDAISIAENIKKHLETLPEDQLTDDQANFLDYFEKYIDDIGDSDYGYDSDEFLRFLGELKTLDPHSYNEFEKENANTIVGFENPLKWSCQQGNILSRNHNFELWGWDRNQEKNLLEMVYQIANEDTVSPTTTLYIHDYAVGEKGKQYITTVGELEANEKAQNVVPGAVKTQSNVHIPWDRSKLVGDNNNFVKFKDWMRLRENRN